MMWAAVGWALVAVIWLASAPRTEGRRWHRILAPIPLLAFAAAAIDGPLRETARIWLAMGVPMLMALLGAWVWGTWRRNHGMMDVAYPVVVAAGAGTAYALGGGTPAGGFLFGSVVVWGARLSVQTYGHNASSERQPYAAWRQRHGRRWVWWSFFQVHLLQGVMVWVWALPFAFTNTADPPLWLVVIAVAVVATGVGLEATADVSLARFRANPANRGKLLTTGVWGLVRHPNYLGESIVWIGWFLPATAAPWGWLAAVGPVFTTWFMGYGSAARHKERHMAKTRPDAWRAYAEVTPRFLPWSRPRHLE